MDAPIEISVRDLVEFLLRSGNIDNRTPGGSPDTALAGIRMHRRLQEEATEEGYRAEVPLGLDWVYEDERGGGRDAASLDVCGQRAGHKEVPGAPAECRAPARGSALPGLHPPAGASPAPDVPAEHVASAFEPVLSETGSPAGASPAASDPMPALSVHIEGRLDGIYRDAKSGVWVVDEIKTTYRSLKSLREPQPLHLAQAKCYAFFWGLQQERLFTEGQPLSADGSGAPVPAPDGSGTVPQGQQGGGQLQLLTAPGGPGSTAFQDIDADERRIGVRVTYGNLLSQKVRRFYSEYPMRELRAWFTDLMEQYRPWAAFRRHWSGVRTDSIRALPFPYPYRPGQKDLAAAVYRTIVHGRNLFLEAPTGTGKTLCVLFPAVKALGEGKADTLFYLTARTTTRTAAEQALEQMRGRGLRLKSVTLMAKEKVCPLGEPDCNPEGCPRALGHYDRVNAAMYDLLTGEDAFTRENVQRFAAAHEVCPYELSLDMSLYSDAVIGDYNYLFDPRAYLRRFFTEADEAADAGPAAQGGQSDRTGRMPEEVPAGGQATPAADSSASEGHRLGASAGAQASPRRAGHGRGEYIFLVDEAHNLVERGRQMYSASLLREDVLSLRRKVKDLWPELYRALGRCSRAMLPLRKAILEGQTAAGQQVQRGSGGALRGAGAKAAGAGAREWAQSPAGAANERMAGAGPREGAQSPPWGRDCIAPAEVSGVLAGAAEVDEELGSVMTKERIAQQSGSAQKDPHRAQKKAVWDEVLNFFYNLEHFIDMGSSMDDHYMPYAQLLPGGRLMVRLYCMDPSRRLRACLQRGRAGILFSATLLPITYYKALLGGTPQDYEIYAQTVFDPRKMGLFVVRDVTSRYRDRTGENYDRIAGCIMNVISQRHGNYMVFFPSYAFLREVEERMAQYPGVGEEDLTANMQAPEAGEVRYAAGERTDLPEADAQGGRILTKADGSGSRGEGSRSRVTLLRQRPSMEEAGREAFLAQFAQPHEDGSLVGLCVAGGIFGEGIDLRGDALIGVIVVGTGVPQVCLERELLKGHFDSDGGNGYDYAYRFPGMNRVQQAAGRVIRTQDDVGIVVLMDERFAYAEYRRLYPREWSGLRVTDTQHIAHEVERFWDEWL